MAARDRSIPTGPTLAGIAVAAAGAAAAIGWHVGAAMPVQLLPGLAPMQILSAIGLIAAGLGLVALDRDRARDALLAGSLCGLFGALTLVQYLVRVDFGIESAWLDPGLTEAFPRAGRMAPNSALALMIFGIALGAGASATQPRAQSPLLGVLGGMVVLLGASTLLGYAVELDPAFGWSRITDMALHSALCFVLLGLGVARIAWRNTAGDRERHGRGISLTAASGLVATILISATLVFNEGRNHWARVGGELDRLAYVLSSQVAARAMELERMADRWEQERGTPYKRWSADAYNYVNHTVIYEGIAWIDPEGRARWTVPEPRPSWARDLESRATLAEARREGRTTLAMFEGERGRRLLLLVPLADGSQIASVLDLGTLFASALAAADIDTPVVISADDEMLYRSADAGAVGSEPKKAEERRIALRNLDWNLRGWPGGAIIHSAVPAITLLGGMFLTLLATSALTLRRTAVERAESVERVSRELERSASRLAEANVQLARSNEELGRFAYVASHDLQEPLRQMSSFSERLAQKYGGALDDHGRTYIGFIVEGATRMRNLIEDLLRYSRVDGLGDSFEAVDVNEALADALDALDTAMREAGADFYSDPLPTVRGSRMLLAQLFQNLIGNSLKYRGEQPPRIRVEVSESDSEWRFAVVDNGIGVEPEYHERIFELFERLPGERGVSGTGIGLAISKKVVERHGGRIWLESNPGEGSRFRFALPKGEPAVGSAASGTAGAATER